MERMSVQKVTHAEAFNKVCEVLNRVSNAQRSDWDLCVLAVLWAYKTMCKKLTKKTPFRLAYGANTIVPREYNMPSLRIPTSIDMTVHGALKEGIAQLNEEERLGPEE